MDLDQDNLHISLKEDIDLIIPSLQYSLDAFKDKFSRTRPGYNAYTAELYRRLWLDLQVECDHQGSKLSDRLVLYSRFLDGMLAKCNGYKISLKLSDAITNF